MKEASRPIHIHTLMKNQRSVFVMVNYGYNYR